MLPEFFPPRGAIEAARARVSVSGGRSLDVPRARPRPACTGPSWTRPSLWRRGGRGEEVSRALGAGRFPAPESETRNASFVFIARVAGKITKSMPSRGAPPGDAAGRSRPDDPRFAREARRSRHVARESMTQVSRVSCGRGVSSGRTRGPPGPIRDRALLAGANPVNETTTGSGRTVVALRLLGQLGRVHQALALGERAVGHCTRKR